MENISRFTAVVGVLAVWVLAVACSDGATPVLPTPQCSLPQPTAGLMAKKVGEADEAAVKGKITIASGEGVVILWDVQGLSGGEIVSNPPEVIGQPEQLIVAEEEKEIINAEGEKEKQKVKTAKGSKEFTSLVGNVEFTLKAINTDKDLPCENVASSVSVEVTPETAKPEVKKFEATPAQINAGEVSKLCWEVAPESAAVTIVDDAGNALVPPVVETTETTETSETTETAFKAVDCVDVKPEKDTRYTLTARANDATATAEASVAMASVEFKIVSFAANSIEGSLTLDAEGDVKLTWEVTPSEGVLVSIDNGVGENLPAVGDATVKVSDNTIYTLSASRNGSVLAKQVTVNVQRATLTTGQQVSIRAGGDDDIFPGEEATLKWEVAAVEGDVPSDIVVTIRGGEFGDSGIKEVAKGEKIVKPAETTEYVFEASAGGYLVATSEKVTVNVREWSVGSGSGSVTAVAVDPSNANRAFFGLDGDLSGGKLKVMEITNGKLSDHVIDLQGAYFTADGPTTPIANKDFLSYFHTYPINAIAVAPGRPERVYLGTTGGLFMSRDGGNNWGTLSALYYVDFNKDYKGEHPTCKGAVQKGLSENTGSIMALAQVCDIIADRNGGLILAKDNGVYYLPSVDGYLSDPKNVDNWWSGNPEPGSKGYKFYGFPAHDVELDADTNIVYAATHYGVFKNTDINGINWEDISGDLGEQAAFAVKLVTNGDKKVLFAGSASGLSSCEVGGDGGCTGAWSGIDKVSGTVYSIATDAKDNVYVGTTDGIFVGRNGGKKWTNISGTGSIAGSGAVRAIGVAAARRSVGIYSGTANGLYYTVEEAKNRRRTEPEVLPATPTEPATPATPESAINVMKSLAK